MASVFSVQNQNTHFCGNCKTPYFNFNQSSTCLLCFCLQYPRVHTFYTSQGEYPQEEESAEEDEEEVLENQEYFPFRELTSC